MINEGGFVLEPAATYFNMFRDGEADSSVYDEAFAIRAPKRIVGGLQVSF